MLRRYLVFENNENPFGRCKLIITQLAPTATIGDVKSIVAKPTPKVIDNYAHSQFFANCVRASL